MIELIIPTFCINEIKYSIECLFNVFLGVETTLIPIENQQDVEIRLKNKKIILKNHFFNPAESPSVYTKNHLPTSADNSDIVLNNKSFNIISLYGTNTLEQSEEAIIVDNDIIAATFFMLSRWEENIVKQRDLHHRFLAEFSVAKKFDFLHRPIVNEYVEFLWELLIYAGYDGIRKAHNYTITPTHDVDFPFLWDNLWTKVRAVLGQIKQGNFSYALKYTKRALQNDDPYDTYQLLMDKAENANTLAHFYFMSGGKTKYDKNYSVTSRSIQLLFDEINKNKHVIGFHPSYNCINETQTFIQEKKLLESASNTIIKEGRQHYLRFNVPETWQTWNDNNMAIDSTMSYADHVGFRCGICYEFPVYDINKRIQLSLKEMPLIAMEVSLKNYQKLEPEKAISVIKNLKKTIKKYNGNFVFLWHNSCLFTQEWESYLPVFKEMYK